MNRGFRKGTVITLLLTGLPATAVDFTTLEKKVLFGYQGWFHCTADGNSWKHWSNGTPTPASLTVDMYPDLKEFQPQDLCKAGSFTIGGKQAYLFSSQNARVVDAHFRWMKEYGLDGVLVQRFIGGTAGKRSSGDVVLRSIMAAALAHGRTFAIEYDITGGKEESFAQMLQADWAYMVDTLKATSHPNYLHHQGKPVVSVWGMGLSDRIPSGSASALAAINWFRSGPTSKYHACYMGGTPSRWRTLSGDSRSDAAWKGVYQAMDVVQPWTVGRYNSLNGVNDWRKNVINGDLTETKSIGNLYMPVIFPGFSWFNLKDGSKQNAIPRQGGRFLWRQAYQAKAAGASMLKIAMYDEVDEGTAMFKLASRRTDAPEQGYWLTLDADGENLPSDWYLRLAGEVTRMFKGERPVDSVMPSNPGGPLSVSALPRAGSHRAFSLSRVDGGWQLTADAGFTELKIYAGTGRILRTLIVQGGRARWDGRDAGGSPLPSGVYLAVAGPQILRPRDGTGGPVSAKPHACKLVLP